VWLLGLGAAYYNIGRHPEAIEMHKQQLLIAQKLGDVKEQATAWLDIGPSLQASGSVYEVYITILNMYKETEEGDR